MLAAEIISAGLPVLKFTDTCGFALQLMEEYAVTHLPVTDSDKFAGLIDKDSLEEQDELHLIEGLQPILLPLSVEDNSHFLFVLKMAANSNLSLVAVINTQKELIGCVTRENLIQTLCQYLSLGDPGGIIVLQMEKRDFSLGQLSRLIETNDAYINQLNTSDNPVTGLMEVTLKINKNEISDIIATLQRYEYSIKFYIGEEDYENELKENYDHLMAYLKM